MIIRRLLIAFPIVVLLVAAVAWFWLLHTQSGARWIWSQVAAATDNALSADQISGDLSSGLVGKGIVYDGDSVHVGVGYASLAVDVDILPLRVTVLPARVADLLIDVRGESQSDGESDLQATFAKLQLPVKLVFTDVELARGELEGIGDDVSIAVDTLSLAGHWSDEWFLERFALAAPLGSATGSGRFALYEDNEIYLDTIMVLSGELVGRDDAVSIDIRSGRSGPELEPQ